MNICCKAVIFDLDGTILDTIEDLGDSINYVLNELGYPARATSHHKKSIGNGLRKFAARCLPEDSVTDELLDLILPRLAARYRSNSMVKTVPYEGVIELFDFLTANGIMLNILSNKRDDFVKELTLHYFPDYNFVRADGELPDVPKKPDPTSALKIAEICGVEPSEILFIGDSVYDIQTGKNAGMRTVAVTWGYQPKDALLAENPDFIADTPAEIIQYIKALNKE